MLKTLLLVFTLIILLTSCGKDDEPIKVSRVSYLIAGDTLNCLYNNYNLSPDSNSIDINMDNVTDFALLKEIRIVDDCEDFYENCPPDVICDCWPNIYIDYFINITGNAEIAIDTDSKLHAFSLNDTISNKNTWTCGSKFRLGNGFLLGMQMDPYYELLLGLRIVDEQDTLYSWLEIRVEERGITKVESAIQE